MQRTFVKRIIFVGLIYVYLHYNLLFEGSGLSLARLADGGVHHKDHVVGAHCIAHLDKKRSGEMIFLLILSLFGKRELYRQHLFEQGILLFVPSRGVDNNDLETLVFEHLNPIASYDSRVDLSVAPIEGNASFRSILLQLIVSSSSECVSTHKAGFPVLLLVVIGKFCACGSFPRTL